MLVAEDLLLLLTDDTTGKHVVSSSTLDLALAGAVLVELALTGAVEVVPHPQHGRSDVTLVRSAESLGDPVLDDSLQRVAASAPRKPQDLLPKIGKGLRKQLLGRLTERGILRAEEGRLLGIFPTHSWPAEDSGHEAEVRAGLHDVLVAGRPADPREAALVSLLYAADAVAKVVTGAPARELERRAGAIADGEFAAEAVRRAVQAVNAAIIAATSSTVVISS